ncbi:DUF2637 domain-containing protein [Streptomyces sp. NPDC087440]|uniref:DUF2637 domain-containing protein n=1 Tax=Streptomyces sp. NPDC087440 TaxID=3365790 RepID=UPI00380E4E6C
MSAPQLTKAHRILIGVVVTGAVIIAGIGFAGSYAAVRELALEKGFGNFAYVFPIGIDAGICVLLALDLLLTWMRIPFPLLRQTAWLLTAATIAFNGAASWPDPLGVGMHAVIPVLFVVSVEAARHAVGRIADITADRHMEGVRLTRWLLSPLPTFRLWRRMKLWELRSYEQVIKLEQDRLIYQSRLKARFGKSWKRRAPIEALMPLRLAKYGIPLADTAPAGLAAAGIEPVLLPPAPVAAAPAPAALEQAAAPEDVPVDGPVSEPTRTGQEDAHVRTADSQPREETRDGHPATLTDEDYYAAFRELAALLGAFPTPVQFGGYLAEVYGVTDPDTGQPLTAEELEPVVSGARSGAIGHRDTSLAAMRSSGSPETEGATPERPTAGEQPVETRWRQEQWPAAADDADDRSPVPDTGPHPFFGGGQSAPVTGQPQPVPDVPQPVATASATGHLPLQSRAPERQTADVAASGHIPVTGEATARLPEQMPVAPEPVPTTKAGQVALLAQQLDEAKEQGRTLNGPDVEKLLGVKSRTARRRLEEARAYQEEQQRTAASGRGHLWPVTDQG